MKLSGYRFYVVAGVLLALGVSTAKAEGYFAMPGDAPQPMTPITNPEATGFELGNGKRMVRNLQGLYGLRISSSWDVGIVGKLTEVISSLTEGTPRARLQINVVAAENIRTFRDLAQLFANRREWNRARIGEMDAVKREATLDNGRCMLDARVFKAPKEVAVITLDGAPECQGESAYAKIKESLDTFYFIQD